MALFENVPESKSAEVSTQKKIIPDNTKLLCCVYDVKIKPEGFGNPKKIVVSMHIVESGEYYDMSVNCNINLFDPKKVKTAEAMLAAIDANSMGMLRKSNLDSYDDLDEDFLNTAFKGAEVLATVRVYDMESSKIDPATGEPFRNRGNWVSAVAAPPKSVRRDTAHIAKQAINQPNAPTVERDPIDMDFEQDIPF